MQEFAEERQIPFVADMNADFRDGYARRCRSATGRTSAASAAICYLTADVRARNNLTIISGATVTDSRSTARRATGVSAQRSAAKRRQFTGREMI